MKYSESNKPLVCMMKNSTCYKGTSKFMPKGVLWHCTGANNPSLARYVQPYETDENYDEMIKLLGYNRYNNDWNHIHRDAGLNCWIGQLADGTVTTVQTMPWDYKPWGCGGGSNGSCNNTHIQFEICEDGLTDRVYFEKAYKEACEITAYLCEMYDIDPKGTFVYNGVTVPTILCHADSYKLGLGSNHGDVYNWFNKHGKTMEDVRNDVAKLMGVSNVQGLQATSLKNLDNAAVIAKVGPLFTADQKKSGVLASVSLAQFILESGYGKSELGQNANNMFGMKCSLSGNTWSGSTWDGSKYTKETKEYVDGGYTTVTADFRKYSCVEDSIADHSAYLVGAKKGSELRYAGLKGEANYRTAAQIIKDGGYATSPTYVDSICDLIEKWNLTKYDAPVQVKEESKFKLGDEVKLVAGATYYNGQSIPSWVFDKTLYVRSINGDKIVISTLKTGDITGTVAAKSIELISNNTPTEKEEPKVEAPADVQFKLGDEVKLVAGAKYASGQSIPSWVFESVLYVREINGDKIIISTLKSGDITGTVYRKDLVAVKDVKPEPDKKEESVSFKLGEEVKLLDGAKFVSGKSIASWVFKKKLYVRAIDGKNITVSILKTGAVTGTVDAKYLVPFKSNDKVESTDVNFKIGDKVKLVSGAKFVSGQSILSWVFNKMLYVRAIDGDNITISILKSGAVTGTVNKKYLKKY